MELLGWVTAAAFSSPKAALAKDLEEGALDMALAELAEAWGVPAPSLPRVGLEDLQAAYTLLFVSNPAGLPCPPYVGLALEERILGKRFEELMDLYQEVGLVVSPHWRDLPDHLAVVGEAMALLFGAGKTQAAWRLALDYLYPWLGRYLPALEAHDPTGFYRTIARFLKEILEVVRDETGKAHLS